MESKDEPQPHTKLNPACSQIVHNLKWQVTEDSEILPLEFPANGWKICLILKSEHTYLLWIIESFILDIELK